MKWKDQSSYHLCYLTILWTTLSWLNIWGFCVVRWILTRFCVIHRVNRWKLRWQNINTNIKHHTLPIEYLLDICRYCSTHNVSSKKDFSSTTMGDSKSVDITYSPSMNLQSSIQQWSRIIPCRVLNTQIIRLASHSSHF